MIIYNVCIDDLDRALYKVNSHYHNNVEFNYCEELDLNTWRVTLRVKDDLGPGHRLIPTVYGRPQRVRTACWHVHDLFMLHLPETASLWIDKHSPLRLASEGFPVLYFKGQPIDQLCECAHRLEYTRPDFGGPHGDQA